MSVRQIVSEPTGAKRDALLRAARAKQLADAALLKAARAHEAAGEAHVLAADRLGDVLAALTGEAPEGLHIDLERGTVYREVDAEGSGG